MVKDRKYKFKLFTMREFVTNAKKIFYQGYQDFMEQSLYQIRSFFSRRENRTLFEKFSATNVLNYRDKVSSIQSSRDLCTKFDILIKFIRFRESGEG